MISIFEKVRRKLRRFSASDAPITFEATIGNELFKVTERADEIVSRVRTADFINNRDCHMLVGPAGCVPLNAPKVVNKNVPSYRIQEPYGIPRPLPDFPTASFYPDLTISRLSDATCVQGGVAISRDRKIIAETFTSHWDRRFHHALKKSPAGYTLQENLSEPKYLEGKYFFLDFQHLSHYGHFIADVLPRLWAYYYLNDLFNIGNLKILITRKPEPFIKEILSYSGINSHDIVEIEESIVVEELFVATKALQLQDYSAPVLRQIWDTIGLRAGKKNDRGKKIYLSRSRHPQRQLLNEIEVERIFQSHGFQVLYPEGLSFSEQAEWIVGAELIAGPSGSNLFTLAFQQNMKSAFIITSPALIHITDSLLQVGRRCELRTYIGEVATTHPSYDQHWVHSPWVIADMDDLTEAVANWVRDFS